MNSGRINLAERLTKGDRMGKLATFMASIFVVALGGALLSDFRAEGQAQETISTSPPTPGAELALRDSGTAAPAGNPLPDDMSLDGLRDLIKLLAAKYNAVTRGAKEIALFRQAAPAVVYLKSKEGSGTGVVLPNGVILTNRHVVEGIGTVQVFFKPTDLTRDIQSAETRTGRVQYVDRRRDLATVVLETLPPGYKFLKIAARDDIEVGADVYAIGHPLGYTWTFTQGIVSGLRAIEMEDQRYTAIQTQTPINMGNSGGPLLNAGMEVVGINTWVRDISTVEKKEIGGEQIALVRPAQGLNFAVSARDVREFLSEIDSGKFANLALQMPSATPGCAGQWIFNGRTKSNDAGLKTLSLRCDNKVDAWQLIPDDKSKPVQFHFDPDRAGKSSIVVLSNVATGKWQVSHWDFFRDRTFAVIGRHDDGNIKPTRFEFARL